MELPERDGGENRRDSCGFESRNQRILIRTRGSSDGEPLVIAAMCGKAGYGVRFLDGFRKMECG